jgi:hypothetical protein
LPIARASWQKGFDEGGNPAASKFEWFDDCPYGRPSLDADAWTAGFLQGRANRYKA